VNIRSIARLTTIVALLATGLFAAPAPAQSVQTMPPDDRVEFNKILQQRNRLVVTLRQLDGQAADLIKQERDATVVHAEQVSAQDQIDLFELRLAILATRHGVAVPPPPSASRQRKPGLDGVDDTAARRITEAFDRGRTRAIARVRQDTLTLLASLDFEAFLSGK